MRNNDVPAVRVLPMSDRLAGFAGRSVEQVQAEFFLGRLVMAGGRFRYPSTGLSADRGAIVLFQFKARAVACAALIRDEPYDKPVGGFAGALWFDVATIRTFRPWDAEAMRTVWPAFGRFGHAKFKLNPGQWPAFVRRMRDVRRPGDAA